MQRVDLRTCPPINAGGQQGLAYPPIMADRRVLEDLSFGEALLIPCPLPWTEGRFKQPLVDEKGGATHVGERGTVISHGLFHHQGCRGSD